MTVVFRRFLRMSAGERPPPPLPPPSPLPRQRRRRRHDDTTTRHDTTTMSAMTSSNISSRTVIHTGAPSPFPLLHYPLFLLFLAICRSRDIDRYVAILSPRHVCLYYLKDRKRLRGVKLLMFVLRGLCLGSEERSKIPVHGLRVYRFLIPRWATCCNR